MALSGSNEDDAPQDLLLVAADLKFDLLHTPDNVDVEASKSRLLEIIKEKKMVHFYKDCVEQHVLELDEMLMGRMEKEVEGLIATYLEEIEKAKTEQGDMEVTLSIRKQSKKSFFWNRLRNFYSPNQRKQTKLFDVFLWLSLKKTNVNQYCQKKT